MALFELGPRHRPLAARLGRGDRLSSSRGLRHSSTHLAGSPRSQSGRRRAVERVGECFNTPLDANPFLVNPIPKKLLRSFRRP